MKLLDAFWGITTSITLLFQKVVIKDALYIFSVTFIIKNSPFVTPHINYSIKTYFKKTTFDFEKNIK